MVRKLSEAQSTSSMARPGSSGYLADRAPRRVVENGGAATARLPLTRHYVIG